MEYGTNGNAPGLGSEGINHQDSNGYDSEAASSVSTPAPASTDDTPGVSVPRLGPDADNLAAALAYAANGIYVLPVKRGSKHPGSVVGNDWPTKSTRDPQVIVSLWAATDYGIALGLGRSGLMALDVDRPADVPAWLLTAIGEAAAPFQATQPELRGRGHYLFAQPPGRRLGNGRGGLAGLGLDVRGSGGVIIAEPSEHPSGGEYRWITPGPVPVVPDVIADKLTDAAERESAAADAEVEAFLAAHVGTERPKLINTFRNKFAEALRCNESRHITMISLMPRVCEEARAGYFPARAAVEVLREAFIVAKMQPYNGKAGLSRAAASDAFKGILAWSIGQAESTPVERIRAGVADRLAAVEAVLSLSAGPDHPAEERTAAGITAEIEALEGDFWQRDSLATIHTAAFARMCSPWAVLACCAARALAQVRPNTVLPALIGGPGSLNWFAAIAAPSGGGKGAAMRVAEELVPGVYVRNLGSGEGFVQAFKGTGPNDTRESVMFSADEIDNVAALAGRSGSTLLAVLRSAFSGEMLGFTYVKSTREGHVEKHSYRMTLTCSVQPGRARALLGDDAGGTPQRFMWFPGDDSRVSAAHYKAHQWMTFALDLPSPSAWQYPREIILPEGVDDEILASRERQQRGEIDALDGHAIFAREKFAYAVAVLDGRVQMSEDDWRLSGIAARVSDTTRAWVAAGMADAERADAEREGQRLGVRAGAADDAKADRAQRQLDRIAARIRKRLAEAGGEISNRDLGQKFKGSERPTLPPVLAAMAEAGEIASTETGWRAVANADEA